MHIVVQNRQDGAEALHSFARDMIESSYSPAYSREAVDQFLGYHSRERIASDIGAGGVWCAYEGDTLIGTATVAGGELSRMFVRPEARGSGVGAALARAAIGYAKDSGVEKLTAWSVPFSRGFYERLGFRVLNADTWNFTGSREPPVPYLEMALWLSPGHPDIAIRRAEGPPDMQEMLSGQRLAFEEQCRLYGDWEIPPMKETPEDALRYMDAGGVVLKAVSGGRIIGGVRGNIDTGICHVGRLWVLPDKQGMGVGRMLVAAVEEACGECRVFSIFTGERSERNLALYRRQGYAETGRRAPAGAPGRSGGYDLVWLEKPSPWPAIQECARRFQSLCPRERSHASTSRSSSSAGSSGASRTGASR